MENNPKNIVLFRTDRIGEVLLSTVAIDCVKKTYPDASVSFVTSEYSRDIVGTRDDLKEIITANTGDRRLWLFEAFRLAFMLKMRHFDMAIILNPHKTLHLACFMAGIPVRAGYDRKWSSLLTRTVKDARGMGEKHEMEYTRDLLRELGIKIDDRLPRLFPDKKAEEFVEKFLRDKNIGKNKPLVAVHPGTSNTAKMWPRTNYADLMRMLKTTANCDVVLVGDEKEKVPAKEIIALSRTSVMDLSGQFNLKELAAFLSRADLFIGNDAGPMHMAAVLGIPVIAIFGRNIPGVGPKRWGPVNVNHSVFHKPPVDCSPCYDTVCPKGYKCFKNIRVDEVYHKAVEMLKSGKKEHGHG